MPIDIRFERQRRKILIIGHEYTYRARRIRLGRFNEGVVRFWEFPFHLVHKVHKARRIDSAFFT